MKSDYLYEPTYGELMVVTLSGVRLPEEEIKEIVRETSQSSDCLKRKYRLPENLELLKTRPQGFLGDIRGITNSLDYSRDYLGGYPISVDDVGKNEFFTEALDPKETVKREGGDCKSLSALALAGMRKLGIPSRFLMENDKHLITEVRVGEDGNKELWRSFDPVAGYQEEVLKDPNDGSYARFADEIASFRGEKPYLQLVRKKHS